ncbi:type II toxin-antitoxin system death-on-curing family toxin (plasmid) [Cyanobacterium sp. IPPAS B-1200]|uniref:type II toxin-antitoxin system death-on-curing family toxin n=1 Tax=Cyanobacterium sp. IPPAS B-1200 TaxID=1562720 RepID=UPI00085264E0|nr:type II toxin-antitoxin system death-on-curing family toxin [Cyanobacterium sp. IPPAS B-1200]OEJ80049.1 death-on-curing protein [Cyanobacterium sp. IPPAS B-1200]
MTEIKWVNKKALIYLHGESLAEHGGLAGIRDEGLLESALYRPLNLYNYEQEKDIVRLAAAYGFGVVRNHPFFDGNKRAGFLAVGLFLALNGFNLIASQLEATKIILALAEGKIGEEEFYQWLENYVQ